MRAPRRKRGGAGGLGVINNSLKHLETHTLETMIRELSASPSEDSVDLITDITSILVDREKPVTPDEIRSSWQKLQEKSTLWDRTSNDIINMPEKRRRNRSIRRRLVAIVAVLALLVGTAVVFAGNDLLGFLRSLGEGIFTMHDRGTAASITTNPKVSENGWGAPEIAKVLAESGLIFNVPTWLPTGFAIQSSESYDSNGETTCRIVFQNKKRSISLVAAGSSLTIAQEHDPEREISVYESNGRNYTVYSNTGQSSAVWTDGAVEISLFGDISEQDIKRMLDSIQVGG